MSIPISYVDDTPPTVGYVGLGSCVCSSNASLKNGITNSIEYWATDDTGVTTVDFDYSTNGGLNWTPIQEGYTPPYAPTYGALYTWPVPTNLPLTTNLEIRVVAWDASGNSGQGVAGPFTVIDGTLPTVTVVSPAAGNVWDMGSTQQIQWTVSSANPIGTVDIDFFYGGIDYGPIAFPAPAPNSTTFEWTLPNNFSTTTGQIRVEVTDVNGNQAQAWSDGYFTVRDNSAPPPPPWTTPLVLQTNAGAVKIATDAAGNVHMVYWTPSGFYYTERTGTNWSTPLGVSSMPGTVGSFSIAVDSHQHPHMAWTSYANSTQNENTQDIFYSYFTGGSWTPATNISESILGASYMNSLLWESTASLPTGADDLASCVIGGKLYVIGVGNFVALYQFDPSGNVWTKKANMPGNGLEYPAAVGLNGKMYVVGQPADGVNFRIYDPSVDSWTTGATMPTTRGGASLVAVNGEIYAIGGWWNETVFAQNEMYNPNNNTWTSEAPLPTACGFSGSASLNNDIYVFGGETANFNSLRSLQVYDSVSNTWIDQSTNGPAPGLLPGTWPPAKEGAVACLVNDRIYLCGGRVGNSYVNAVDEYNPANNTWQSMNPMQSVRASFAGGVVGSNIYVAGGFDGTNYPGIASVETATITSNLVGTASSSQSIAIDTNDTVNIIWADGAYYQPDPTSFTGFTEVGTNVVYYISKSSNQVWSAPLQLTSLWAYYPVLSTDRANTVHVAFGAYLSGSDAALMYMNKTNGAWSVPIELTSQQYYQYYYLAMAVDSTNHLHFAWRWYDEANGISRIMDGFFDGVNFFTNEFAYSSVGAFYPTINADSLDRPHITVEDYNPANGNYRLLYTSKSANTWSPPIQLNLNSQPVFEFSSDSAIATISNELHVVWESSVNGVSSILYNEAFVGSTNDTFPPSVSVLSPSDGQILAIASTFNIQWQANDNVGVAKVNIDYSTNGGASWLMIGTNQPNTGSFAWFVPNCGTNLAQVRITALDGAGNAGYGYSGSFSTANLTPPTIVILSPASGASLTGNTVVPVLWNASDNVAVTNVYLEYSLNNGSTWLALTSDPSNSGSFLWLVPNSATSTLLLRVTAKDSAGFTAVAATAQPLSIVRGNNPPIAPYNPFPLAGGINVPFTAPILQWQSGDVDGDSLTYQVLLGTNATPPYAANLAQPSFIPGFLAPQTTYYWQVLVSDGKATTAGPIWTFTTQDGSRPKAVVSGQTTMSNGAFQFQFSGIFGQNYALQASTNLIDWVTITNVLVNGNPMLAIDPNARNYRLRFYRLSDQIGGATIYISSFQRLPNHTSQFQVNGILGQTYAIQVSGDLVNWTNLANVTLTNSPVPFSDSGSTNINRRFYRLISQ
jgi:N-acetylneuraminic acid mutarotase